METSVIVVKQLPVIEEQLRGIKAEIEARVAEALALECTEETVKEIKNRRAELNKSFADFENRRKDVKNQILAPYEAFETIYKECITDVFKGADKTLAIRIGDIENSMKEAKMKVVSEFFYEYRESLGLREEDAPIKNARINVTLSASLKSLKATAAKYLDDTAEAISMIREQEYADEIMVEYRRTGNANQAVLIVNQRHREIEQEQKRNSDEDMLAKLRSIYGAEAKVDAAIEQTAQEALTAPTAVEIPQDEEESTQPQNGAQEPQDTPDSDIYEVTFTVRGTIAQIKALKEFLNNGGYDYE